jgi:hypothetical protein
VIQVYDDNNRYCLSSIYIIDVNYTLRNYLIVSKLASLICKAPMCLNKLIFIVILSHFFMLDQIYRKGQ